MSSIQHHKSKDGSSTLYSNEFQQFYHNPNGAISESRHVFFEKSGVLEVLKSSEKPISIFEMGFGTGLNYLLLLEYVLHFNIKIPVHYYTIEAFPISIEKVHKLNYFEKLNIDFSNDHLVSIFSNLKKGWNQVSNAVTDSVQLSLFFGRFNELLLLNTSIDLFFHDPFSPEANPELWSFETFATLKEIASEDAILTTYCAASKARASMAKAGWKVARAEGALGKREMTIASLNSKKLSEFKRVNEERLINRYDNGEFDN